MVGYSVAYIFHISSCGYLFLLEEFTGCSCCLVSCGWTVDLGGPEGTGFADGEGGRTGVCSILRGGNGRGGGGC